MPTTEGCDNEVVRRVRRERIMTRICHGVEPLLVLALHTV